MGRMERARHWRGGFGWAGAAVAANRTADEPSAATVGRTADGDGGRYTEALLKSSGTQAGEDARPTVVNPPSAPP